MMFCTVADKSYVHKALVMIRSLERHHPGANVAWLCLDDESYEVAMRMHDEGFIPGFLLPCHISKLMRQYKELAELKHNINASQYGDAYSQWCWTLAPFFTWHLGKTYNSNPESEPLFYIDADIWFPVNGKQSIFNIIFEYAKSHQKGILVHSHRNVDPGKYDTKDTSGYYNVGIIGFTPDNSGQLALEWWKNIMLNPYNVWAKDYGSCGDQKYLDLLPILFNPDHILEFDAVLPINHGAPWNVRRHIYHPGEQVQYLPSGGGYKPGHGFDFYHFSHFVHDFENKTWHSNFKGEWDPENAHPYIKQIYEDYFRELYMIHKLLQK